MGRIEDMTFSMDEPVSRPPTEEDKERRKLEECTPLEEWQKQSWKKFSIICNKCGRHEDEGVTVGSYGTTIMIQCICGEDEEQ